MNVKGTSGIFANQTLPLNGGILVFGRSASSCNIVFPDNVRGISRMHCKVDNSTGVVALTDLGSSYGTYLNGIKLQPNMPVPLKNGDTFYLGDQSNSFLYEDPNASVMKMLPSRMQDSPITYVNSGMQAPVTANGSLKKGMIIVASAAAVIIFIIAAIAISSYNSAQSAKQQAENARQEAESARQQAEYEKEQAQKALEDEKNKGPLSQTVDAIDSWLEYSK